VVRWQRQRVPKWLSGPLVPFLNCYADALNDEGYSEEAFLAKTRLIMQFSRWLGRKHVAITNLTIRHAENFLRHYPRKMSGRRTTLKTFIQFLLAKMAAPGDALTTHEPSDVDLLLSEYSEYLEDERGLASTSIGVYTSAARKFVSRTCPLGRARLHSLSAQKISDFVREEAKNYRSSKGLSLLTVAIRSFLRFIQFRGYADKSLADAVPRVACWSMASIPRALPLKSVRRVLSESKRRRTPCGLRDRAILLLLARLGLRAREVALLELEDIDWANSCIYVCGKGRKERPLPLPKDVGCAIAKYLRNGRHPSSSRRVFLRARAPWQGMAAHGSISAVVLRALKRSGIKSATYGAHQFRHSLATNMLRQGASLTEIGQVLRHRDPNTTRLYTKVDLDSLRAIALPWPGRPQ
jgi:site-specific recombinase XerD